MSEIEKILEEYESLMGNTDPVSEARKSEILQWLEEHKSDKLEAVGGKWSERVLKEIEADVEDIKQQALRSQFNDKAYKLIPWSYIAKEYFGKSVSWLTQRINGYSVRGKVYSLNEEQKATLNQALQDIGKYIGSFRVA